MIGDQRTAALVTVDGTIDFWCAPEFDSPTVFASLLDASHGGHFAVAPVGGTPKSQRYVRDTNVLVTTFSVGSGEVELVDFMPLYRTARPAIVRLVTVRGAPATMRMRCEPRFDYARAEHSIVLDDSGAEFCSGGRAMARLTSSVLLQAHEHDVVAEVQLAAGERVVFVLEYEATQTGRRWSVRDGVRAMRRTIVHWRRWIARCRYRGRWHKEVRRSALALALLHSRRTGAIVAAPTFGLPEQIGGHRNWDFRFSWIRDTSFIVFALTRLGLELEGTTFASWIEARCAETAPGELQSVYGIDGGRVLTERTLDHLEGYRGSRPVRIGNDAYQQFQLDIYGELVDALYIQDTRRSRMSRAQWQRIAELADWVCENWRRPDQGIWEVRTAAQEFLYSRVMCWVALDRALRLARRHRFPAPLQRWHESRAVIREDVDENFWNTELKAYVGSKGSNAVDAASLIMPIVGFLSGTDTRWIATLARIEERLVRDGLVRRYELPGMDTDAGRPSAPSFTICSFWYVECLARAGRQGEAVHSMERLLARANHLGLYSEDLSPEGQLLGNFPQALPHLALIGAALAR